MAVKVDVSSCTYVVVCTDCVWWRALRLSHLEALIRANSHERSDHPGEFQAFKALYAYLARHADETGIVEVPAEAYTYGNSRHAGAR